jgi:hypothetical protein
MNRYFVCRTLPLVLLILAPFKVAAQTGTLQLILEGPFVICENPGAPTLTIGVPNLGINKQHHIPGLSTNLEDLALGDPTQDDVYATAVFDLEVSLSLNWPGWPIGKPHVMQLDNTSGVSYYSEKGDCSKLDDSARSLLFTVPIPDKVSFERPLVDLVYVSDASNINASEGPCTKAKPCHYGTKLVLEYSAIDLTKIEVDTTCNGPGPCTSPDHDQWTLDPGAAIDGILEMELSAEPIPFEDDDHHTHAKDAFSSASQLSGIPRILNYPGVILYQAATHQVCQVPSMLLCSSKTSATACPAQ